MIAAGVQEGLVDRSSNEGPSKGLVAHHMRQRLGMSFDPESVVEFHVLFERQRGRLTCTDHYTVICGKVDGTKTGPELACEEIILRPETPVGLVWVAKVSGNKILQTRTVRAVLRSFR